MATRSISSASSTSSAASTPRPSAAFRPPSPSIPPRPTPISNWAASPASRAVPRTRWRISRPSSSRTKSTAPSEIHRELGAVYLALNRNADAERELALYTDRREYDPEGLYYYGQALERNGKPAEARAVYARAVESARTAPRYRRRIVAKWSRLAQRAGKL